MICKICNTEINSEPINVREMMFGLRTVHEYRECPNCEALQIVKIPDLGRYYPDNYYSFKKQPNADIRPTYLRKIKSSYLLYNRNKIIGSLLSIGYRVPEYTSWLKVAGVNYDDAILDVGSGSGDILSQYCRAGFTDLTGIDPFLQQEFKSSNGRLKLLRKSIFDEHTPGGFDFVMLNHSFEHMDNPGLVFRRLSQLVKPGRMLLIRTPVNKSFASKKYGIHWVDLDAPRHLVVHSVKSIGLLANANHFALERTDFDSTAFQFWGSEQYLRDIPLHDPASLAMNKNSSLFSKMQISKWRRLAEDLNKSGEGDQASFYLRRITE